MSGAPHEPAAQGGPAAVAPKGALFRDEAVRLHLRAREFGGLLEQPPAWTRWAYPIVVAALLGLVAWVALSEAPREALADLLLGRRPAGRP